MMFTFRKQPEIRNPNPISKRHARLFELLRQENLATIAKSHPAATPPAHQVDPGFALRAARSLRA